MDKLEEIKKIKQLLDEGIIDENDFKTKKAQILGIESKTQNEKENVEIVKEKEAKSKSLDDYEKKLTEQLEKVKEEKLETKMKDDYYQQEKLKVKAKLDVEEEMRSKRRAEQKSVVNKGINKTKRILKWILTVFLLIFGIASIFTVTESRIVYIPLGILTLALGGMTCPKITDKTQKYEAYTMHKTTIVWIIVIVWIVLCMIGGANTTSKVSNEDLNQITINSEADQ